MTVSELIDRLQQIEDKEIEVGYYDMDYFVIPESMRVDIECEYNCAREVLILG